MGKDVEEQWLEELLNPDTVRTKLVMMGLFMVAHELLKDCIVSTPLTFFADEWKDGKPIQSEEYKTEILGLSPKGAKDNGKVWRGSIEWLKKMSAIDGADESSIREVTDVRNDFAHEMRHFVSGQRRLPDLEKYFPTILDLITKLERWRFLAIEMGILSDSDSRIPDIHGILRKFDQDEPVTGPMVAMRVLCQVALGDHDEAWALHHLFSGLGRA